MAYNKILNITKPGHLNKAAEYILNAEKTRLEILTEYVTDVNKTKQWERKLVSGINCFPETAVAKIIATKKKFGKTDKRLAYHVVQSFAPGEITPELAHEMGVKYAEAWLGDYEVIIGTHLDQNHLHNHIIFNSVSCVDGKKFHIDKSEFYTKLYGISNDLCRKYGLSVIENIDSRKMTYEEWLQRYGKGGRTLKEIIHGDVECCIGQAQSIGEFFMLMENLGYEVNTTGKHAKVRPLERERFFRLSSLGFPDDVLREMLENKTYFPPEKVKPKAKAVYYGRGNSRKRSGHKLTRIEAMYVRWLYVLGKIKPYEKRRVPMDEYQKFDRYRRQLKFISQNGLTDMSKVLEQRNMAALRIKELDVERFRLRGAMKGYCALFEAHRNYMRYAPIAEKLEGEHKVRFENAKEVLREKGYEDKKESVEEKRVELQNAIARNKRELGWLRGRLAMLDGIVESCGHIRQEQNYYTEVDEKWKEKQQDSYSREQR